MKIRKLETKLVLHNIRRDPTLIRHTSEHESSKNECGVPLKIIVMAGENEFESFLQSISLAGEYLERFKETGFNDVELVKSLESEEQRQMFDLVGLSAKPGHLLKFKKSIASYVRDTTATQGIENGIQSFVPQKKVQKSRFF